MVKFLGVTDSINTCDCCGKNDPKRTVELEINGEFFNYGTTCAGRALGGRETRTVKDVKAAVEKVNELDRIKAEVDRRREKTGGNWVYGRFYISRRTIRTHVVISENTDLLVHQIYP